MKTILLLTTLLLLAAVTEPAHAQIRWRVSVKFIVGPNNEMPCCGEYDSFADITNKINDANAYLTQAARGYQFELTEVATVPGISQWFDSSRDEKGALEEQAERNPGLYKWRHNAINVYINNWQGTASCSFPESDDIVFVGQLSYATSLFHEIGHYFNLYHTHQGEGASCKPGDDDYCDDTLKDSQCFSSSDPNPIAQATYGANHNQLNWREQALVDNTLYNLMSYRTSIRDRLTSDQLDRMTDAANNPRRSVTTGRTWFVRTSSGCINPDGNLNCTWGWYPFAYGYHGGPFSSVSSALSAARAGDIVLLSPGTYRRSDPINQPVTLRATRTGPVTITR